MSGNMILIIVLCLTMIKNVESEGTVFGQIKTDTGFYYRKLSEFPSKLAKIQYDITLNKTNIELHCANDEICLVRLDIYTTEDDQNLRTKCSNNVYGQLRNENLYTPLRHGTYRFTTCKLDDVDSDLLHCKGRITIQDYKPRQYGFSFGYPCHELVRPSLVELSFNFTILAQSNRITCIKTPKNSNRFFKCHEFYDHTSLPNFIGDLDQHDVQNWMASNEAFTIFELFSSSEGLFCYKYFRELMCRVSYPECNPSEKLVIHICRATCYEFVEACLKNVISTMETRVYKSTRTSFIRRGREPIYLGDEVDCDYLPFINNSTTCFYKPVTCDPPPNVTNARKNQQL